MNIKKLNEEVYVLDDPIVTISSSDVKRFIDGAKRNERKRIRYCAHKTMEDMLHEMFIVLPKGGYIRPHRHMNKSESFHIVEGRVDIAIFDDAGKIVDVIELGDYRSGKSFFYRASGPFYHTPLIVSGYAIFHETTNGPFKREDTIWAPWAPDDRAPGEDVPAIVKKYMEDFSRSVADFKFSAKGDEHEKEA